MPLSRCGPSLVAALLSLSLGAAAGCAGGSEGDGADEPFDTDGLVGSPIDTDACSPVGSCTLYAGCGATFSSQGPPPEVVVLSEVSDCGTVVAELALVPATALGTDPLPWEGLPAEVGDDTDGQATGRFATQPAGPWGFGDYVLQAQARPHREGPPTACTVAAGTPDAPGGACPVPEDAPEGFDAGGMVLWTVADPDVAGDSGG